MIYVKDVSLFSWLRLVTPILLIFISFYINTIDKKISCLDNTLATLDERILKHMMNDEMHTPKSMVVTKAEFSIYQEMRNDQMTSLKDDMFELRKGQNMMSKNQAEIVSLLKNRR